MRRRRLAFFLAPAFFVFADTPAFDEAALLEALAGPVVGGFLAKEGLEVFFLAGGFSVEASGLSGAEVDCDCAATNGRRPNWGTENLERIPRLQNDALKPLPTVKVRTHNRQIVFSRASYYFILKVVSGSCNCAPVTFLVRCPALVDDFLEAIIDVFILAAFCDFGLIVELDLVDKKADARPCDERPDPQAKAMKLGPTRQPRRPVGLCHGCRLRTGSAAVGYAAADARLMAWPGACAANGSLNTDPLCQPGTLSCSLSLRFNEGDGSFCVCCAANLFRAMRWSKARAVRANPHPANQRRSAHRPRTQARQLCPSTKVEESALRRLVPRIPSGSAHLDRPPERSPGPDL